MLLALCPALTGLPMLSRTSWSRSCKNQNQDQDQDQDQGKHSHSRPHLIVGNGKNVPTVLSATTSAAAASTRTASSSAPLWVGSSLRKAVLDHPPQPQPPQPQPPLPPSLGNGNNVATVNSATTSAAAASTRTVSSSAPLWVGSSLRKAVLEAQHAVSAETTKPKFSLLMKPTPTSCTTLHQWMNLGVTLNMEMS